MAKPLCDQVVVITGASQGIGRETALQMARGGASVVLAARNTEALDELAIEVNRLGGQAEVVATDVADHEQVEVENSVKRRRLKTMIMSKGSLNPSGSRRTSVGRPSASAAKAEGDSEKRLIVILGRRQGGDAFELTERHRVEVAQGEADHRAFMRPPRALLQLRQAARRFEGSFDPHGWRLGFTRALSWSCSATQRSRSRWTRTRTSSRP
jgi:hypothetical protein